MDFFEFAYPTLPTVSSPSNHCEEGKHNPADPPSVDETTQGVHYHTWRNVIARESLAEKEVFDPANNPERIPQPHNKDRYQDQNFIQVVQPLQVFYPITLAGGKKQVTLQDGKGETQTETKPDPVEGGIKGVVIAAVEAGLKVKAVGSGHSFSDVATTSDFLIVTDGLNEILEPMPTNVNSFSQVSSKSSPNIRHFPYLKKVIQDEGYEGFLKSILPTNGEQATRSFYGKAKDNPDLVEFEAGIKIEALNEALWKRKKSLYNMGTYQGQSFIGAASTSTHGAGHRLPPLPDMIKSMVIVVDGGYVFRIEPTIGITQPTAPGELDQTKLPPSAENVWEELVKRSAISKAAEDHVDFLIQDDAWFASALVNVGTFGIVYSVIIEVVPQYYLLETAELSTWEEVRKRLKEQNHYLHRDQLPPKQQRSIANTSELFEWRPFTARVPRDPHRPCGKLEAGDETITVDEIVQTIIEVHPHKYPDQDGPHICRIVRRYKVEVTSPVANRTIRLNNWGARIKNGRKVGEGSPFVLAPLNCTAESVRHDPKDQEKKYEKDTLLNAVAIMRPTSGRRAESMALFNHRKQRLEDLLEVGNIPPYCSDYYVNRNYFTHVLAYFPGYGVELAFSTKPTASTGSIPAYIAAMNHILDMAQKHWETGRYIQSSPIAMRFVKASNAHLAMQYSDEGEPSCMIELLNQIDTHGGKELFYRYERELFRFGARPHWGLDLSVTTGNNGLLANMYPQFPQWHKAYKAFNYKGTFNNRFTDRMGL